MRAVVYHAIGELPVLAELPEPACPADGVVLQVGATGLCRSDWHAWRGHDPVPLPQIPGHEYAGEVIEVGRQVTGWQIGDRVTVPFVLGCMRCEWCRAGEAQVCPDQEQPGFSLPGSYAERLAVPRADGNLVRLPDGVSYAAAALLGCRFATAYRAVVTHGRLAAGQWLAVHGCGGVGLSAIMVGRALGARVAAVDLGTGPLAAARELGAEVLIDARTTPDTAAAIQDRTGGGAHVSLDAIGNPAAACASVNSLRRRGRHVQVGLLLGEAARTALPMDRVISRELEIYGSHGMPARAYPALLDLVARGVLDPEGLVSRRIGLAEAGAALAAMDSPPGPGTTLIVP